ncbi:MAG: hypothetical protein JJE27_08180, partial [Thermoleophilia bacterium]|nr:hypothetical protein [Thermoleophilia bacterium]
MTEKTTTGRLIAAAGGIVLIISLFLNWYTYKAGLNIAGVNSSSSTGISAWDAFSLIDLLLLVIGLLAIVPAALDVFDMEVELPVDMSVVTMAAGALAVLLIVFRVIDKPGPDVSVNIPGVEAGVHLAFGLFIGLISSAAIAFGGFTQTSESGGVDAYSGTAPGAP